MTLITLAVELESDRSPEQTAAILRLKLSADFPSVKVSVTDDPFADADEPEGLTAKQAAFYREIFQRCHVDRNAPTVRELGAKFRIASPNGVICHLKALTKKGWITYSPKQARSIRVLQPLARLERSEASRLDRTKP